MTLLISFFGGIAAAILALFAELIAFASFFDWEAMSAIQTSDTNFAFLSGGIALLAMVAICEEVARISLLAHTVRYAKESRLPSQLFSFILFGIGFSLVEITLASLQSNAASFGDIAASMIGTSFIHIASSIFLGSVLIRTKRLSYIIPATLLAIALHLLYNISIAS